MGTASELSLGISVRHQVHAENIVGSPAVGPRVIDCKGNYLDAAAVS
jgi:hypothetical protein